MISRTLDLKLIVETAERTIAFSSQLFDRALAGAL
jgi:hypothetical protein